MSLEFNFEGKNSSLATEDFFQLNQVHGDQIVLLDSERDLSVFRQTEGDAIVCSLSGLGIAIRTADCVPILLFHPRGIIAAIHAGWRGSALKILEKTIYKIEQVYQIDPSEIELKIGPAICGACYEVGEEVAADFQRVGEGKFLSALANSKYLLDLKMANLEQAQAAGLHMKQVWLAPDCTRCLPEKYYSHRHAVARGESNAGRNYAWIRYTNNVKENL